MKRNFIKEYFKAVVVAVFAAATISACEKGSAAAGAESYDSEIHLTAESKIVSVDAAESEFTVSYTVTGAKLNQTVTAEVGAEWLSLVVEGDGWSPAGVISKSAATVVRSLKFKAAVNESAGSRTGSVTFRLDGAKDVKCTVIQAANPDYVVNSQMTFTLDVTDIEEASVRFTVAPSMSDSYYLYAFVKKAAYDSYGGNYVAMTVKEIQDYAKEYEEKYETGFVLKNRLYKGYVSTTASGLDPDTDYCLVAFDITLGYGYSGNVAVKEFRTKAVPPSSDAFAITYDDLTGIVMFTPAATTSGSYCIGVTALETWEAAKAPSVLVSNYISNASPAAYSVSDGARGLPVGSYSDVTSGEYVAFAFTYNQTTGKASNIAWLQFTVNK